MKSHFDHAKLDFDNVSKELRISDLEKNHIDAQKAYDKALSSRRRARTAGVGVVSTGAAIYLSKNKQNQDNNFKLPQI